MSAPHASLKGGGSALQTTTTRSVPMLRQPRQAAIAFHWTVQVTNRQRWSALVLVTAMSLMAGPGTAAAAEPIGASSCSGCHAGRVAGPSAAVPSLVGRKAVDLVAQMQAFKSGAVSATVMDRIAKGFTDPEIEAIAAWYAGQR